MANDEASSELNPTPDLPEPSSAKVGSAPLHLVSWSAGFVLAVFALTAVLLAFRVPSTLAAAWCLLSLAALIISEGDGLRAILKWDWQSLTPDTEKTFAEFLSYLEAYVPEDAEPQWPLMRNLRYRRFSEAFVALSLAALSLLSSPLIGIDRPIPTPSRSISPELSQRLDQIESEVTKCREQKCACQTQPNSNNGDSTVHFDPQIQKALLDFLQKAASGSTVTSPALSFSWPIWLVFALLAAIAVGILILVFRKHPEAAPPLGAAGLAGAVIAKTSQFSRFDQQQGWALLVLALFGTVTLALATWFFHEIRQEPASAIGKDDPRLKSFASLWLTLFSVFVLLWVLVLVCFQPAKENVGGAKIPPPLTELKVDDKLPAVAGFVFDEKDALLPKALRGEMPKEVQQNLIAKITEDKPAKGDVLLLIGSADCLTAHSYPGGNKGLAKDRAEWVAGKLRPETDALGLKLQTQPLETHEACRQADGMRAVYPILIQTKPVAN
jgi:hypothetical protein